MLAPPKVRKARPHTLESRRAAHIAARERVIEARQSFEKAHEELLAAVAVETRYYERALQHGQREFAKAQREDGQWCDSDWPLFRLSKFYTDKG